VTNEVASTFLQFGSNDAFAEAYGVPTLVLNHEARIKNLEPKARYGYIISSVDSSGNLAKSEQLFFTTPDLTQAELELIASTTKAETIADKESLMKNVVQKAMDILQNIAGQVSLGSLENTLVSNYNTLDKLAQLIPAPVLGGEPAVDITPTTATIRWKTDKQANSMVAYAPEGLYAPSKGSRGYLQLVGEPNQSATDHTVKIVGLKPDSTYHYQLRSKAKIGVEATSRDFVFRTKPEALEIISVNTETLSNTRAKFTWLTSQETDTELAYTPYRNGKLSPDETKSLYDKTVTTSHELEAKDLEAGVIYQFEIRARDKKGIRISKTISFFSTTKDDLPPEITDIQTESALSQSKESRVQTIMTWTTSEPTVSQIRYAKGVFENEADLVEETPLETVYSRKHTIVVTKFEIGEVYSFRVVATDSGGNQSVSSPHIVLTPKQKEGVFELIINTFESTFGWLGQMK
jgi:chitodextrinase